LQATEAMEIFDELFESEVAIVVPHLKPIVDLCMKIAAEEKLDDQIRVKAISFLGRLTKVGSNLVKHFQVTVVNGTAQ
jgi:hypothetical protein